MSNNKKYIKLNITNNDYEIYVITEDKKIKLSNKNTLIMSKVIKKYPCKQINENTYIYPNIVPIMISFYKEKSKLKNKKVNRKKSRNIATSIILTISLAIGGGALANNLKARNNTNDNQPTIESYDDSYTPDISTNIETTNLLYTEETNESIITLEKDEPTNEEEIDYSNMTYFNYEYEDIGDKEALENAKQYMDIFKKYEKMYGIDAKILCSIAAQESSGIHKSYSENGYATGLMGIENVWDGETIKVFNFETNAYETIKVDYSNIGNVDYNIKIGTAIYQMCAYNVIEKDSNYIDESEIIPLSFTAYNGGIGNKNKVIEESKETGTHWMECRNVMRGGDKNYLEHNVSRFDNDTIVTIKLKDGTCVSTCFNNLCLTNSRTK